MAEPLHDPDYDCELRGEDFYCEHDPEPLKSRLSKHCLEGWKASIPVGRATKYVDSKTPIDIPPEAVSIADTGAEVDPTSLVLRAGACLYRAGKEEFKNHDDVTYLNLDATR